MHLNLNCQGITDATNFLFPPVLSSYAVSTTTITGSVLLSDIAEQKTRPLLSNGRPLLLAAYVLGACLPSRCLAMGICLTMYRHLNTVTSAKLRTGQHMWSS
jgi:hypothetical protein